jgi:hypothetical protein
MTSQLSADQFSSELTVTLGVANHTAHWSNWSANYTSQCFDPRTISKSNEQPHQPNPGRYPRKHRQGTRLYLKRLRSVTGANHRSAHSKTDHAYNKPDEVALRDPNNRPHNGKSRSERGSIRPLRPTLVCCTSGPRRWSAVGVQPVAA